MGLIVVLAVMGITALFMCVVYKRNTGESLPESLFSDIFTKG